MATHIKIKMRIPSVRGCSDAKLGGQLMLAVQRGDFRRVAKIVQDSFGNHDTINLNCSDERGKTLLMHAAALPCKPIVDLLLSRPEVDVNMTDDDRKTALHHVCKRDTRILTEGCEVLADIVQSLLAHGACIDACDHKGRNALMFAASSDNEFSVDALLGARCPVNVKDVNGHTAIDYAKKFAKGVVSVALREAGADEDEYETDDVRSDFVVTLTAERVHAGFKVRCSSSVPGEELAVVLLPDGAKTTWRIARVLIRTALLSRAQFKLHFVLEDGRRLTKEHGNTCMANLFGALT